MMIVSVDPVAIEWEVRRGGQWHRGLLAYPGENLFGVTVDGEFLRSWHGPEDAGMVALFHECWDSGESHDRASRSTTPPTRASSIAIEAEADADADAE